MQIYNLIAIGLTAYFLGTIPWAMIVVKILTGQNITSLGTGNVGAMNSFDITHKKWVGILVWFLDMLKGFAAVLIPHLLKIGMNGVLIAGICVVLGHNYNIFLKFKGGRGLSAAMGALIFLNPLMILIWGILWLVGYFLIRKNVHIGNFTATVLTPFIIWAIPKAVLYWFMFEPYRLRYNFFVGLSIIGLIILLRHLKPLRDLNKNKKCFNK